MTRIRQTAVLAGAFEQAAPELDRIIDDAQSIRIEVSSDHSLLLPHGDLVFADQKSKGKYQQFQMVFATHEVLVGSHCLRRSETAMQRLDLSFVTQFPATRME